MEIIWTATSVLPVPGGPTTTDNPGCIPDLIASTCVGVNGIVFLQNRTQKLENPSICLYVSVYLPFRLIIRIWSSINDSVWFYK